jgi:hypothetical protein
MVELLIRRVVRIQPPGLLCLHPRKLCPVFQTLFLRLHKKRKIDKRIL